MASARPKTRPKNVPSTARWYAEEGCWEDGPRGEGGARKGDWTGWRTDGTVLWTAQYLHPTWHDALHGTVKHFDRRGKVTRVEHYDTSKRVPKPPELRAPFERPRLTGTPYDRLMKLDAALRATDHEDYAGVAWKKVSQADIAKAEKKLGTKLPPSYVDFVTKHGIFWIEGTNKAVYGRLLPPLEIAKLTLDIRRGDLEEHDSKFLADALCFQGNPYDDDFYVFRVSSRRKDGEMNVGEWNHDDDSFWSKRFKTFDAHVAELCANWCDELE